MTTHDNKTMRIVLLPGMDGTASLFGAFLHCLPTGIAAAAISYPHQVWLSYQELEALVFSQLPPDEEYIIVAESYSGPIALRLASRMPPNLRAVVLVSSFAFRPYGIAGTFLAKLPLNWITSAQNRPALETALTGHVC